MKKFIANTKTKIKQYRNDQYCIYCFDMTNRNHENKERISFILWYVTTLLSVLWHIALVKYCNYFGHSFTYNGSYGTPNGGAECIACVRCDSNWHHKTY